MPVTTKLLTQALTITAGAYSASDVVGGLITFTGMEIAGGGATLRRVKIVDDDNEKAAMKLYLFRTAPTTFNDNDAFAPTVADLKLLSMIVAIGAGDYTTLNGNAVALIDNIGVSMQIGSKLYAYLVCDATPTYTATTDLYLELLLWME